MWKEFLEFLQEYKVIGLAIAFVMGAACNAVVKSLVDNIIMPMINPLFSDGSWQSSTLDIGSVSLKVGAFMSDLIYFLIIALVIFIVAKKLFKEDKVSKK
jgi:large conductance mechanosensitive channel